MTDEALWRAVGNELRDLRRARGWAKTARFKAAHRAAPSKNTLDQIEAGIPGTADKVSDYCVALGTTLTAIIQTVLSREAERPTLTVDAFWVGESYEMAKTADVADLKRTMRQLAGVIRERLATAHGSTRGPSHETAARVLRPMPPTAHARRRSARDK